MSELAEKRLAFTQSVGNLLDFAATQGLHVVLGEVMRGKQQSQWNASHCAVQRAGQRCELEVGSTVHGPAGHRFVAIGIASSLHGLGLAVDLIRYIPTEHGDWKVAEGRAMYAPLGEYWEQHKGAVWGGSWGHDYGHFSFEHGGRK